MKTANTTFDDKVADLLQELRTERDRYKTALEGIAGFPHQYFDEETPWHMRKLAEHALIQHNAEHIHPE